MTVKPEDIISLVGEIRRAFQELGAFANALHEGAGVTASMRAVLEHLHAFGPQTAPQIARAKRVSRQHIQSIVDALIEAGFVKTCFNPEHKRSVLIALTAAGARVFAQIAARERPVLEQIAQDFESEDIAVSVRTIRKLRRSLEAIEKKETKHAP